jgi:predicted 3-demethylubiquinone-9 3-methyltransferase (glyoxalase superfamily)
MQKIGPCLWFDGQAEEAAKFYVSIFSNSRIVAVSRYPEGSPMPAGSVLMVQFVIDGAEFMALNGGPQYKFTPAVSFVVHCQGQDEVDRMWRQLCEGGVESRCGWLTDKFGVSWQIVPDAVVEMMSGTDGAATRRAVAAMMGMHKLDIAVVRRAYDNA